MVYAVSRLTIIFRGFLADVCLVGVQLLFRSKERNIHGHKQAHSQTHTHTHTHRSWQKRGHDTCCCHSLSQLSPERAQTKFTWKWHQMLWGCSICVCVPVHNHRRCMSARSCLCAHLDARACMFSYPPENTYTRVSIHLCVCVRVCVCVCVCVFSWPRLWQRWMRQRLPCEGVVCFCVSDLWPLRGLQQRTCSPTVH